MKIHCNVKIYHNIPFIQVDNKTSDLDKLFNNSIPVKLFLTIDKNNNAIPALCISKSHSEEAYDYNWDEELEFRGIETEYTYVPIKYNLFTGDRIDFIYDNVIDCSEDVDKLLDEYKLLRKKKQTLKTTKQMYNLIDSMNKLLNSVAFIKVDDISEIYGKEYSEYDLTNPSNFLLDYYYDYIKPNKDEIEVER
jgi:hypothetical protein